MESSELRRRLLDASQAGDETAVTEACYRLVSDLTKSRSELRDVRTILEFMEANPATEWGTPGPLVSFVERFHGSGFDEALLESLRRRPTPHTTWMLNRLINATKDAPTRARLIAILREIPSHQMADADTQRRARFFVSKLR